MLLQPKKLRSWSSKMQHYLYCAQYKYYCLVWWLLAQWKSQQQITISVKQYQRIIFIFYIFIHFIIFIHYTLLKYFTNLQSRISYYAIKIGSPVKRGHVFFSIGARRCSEDQYQRTTWKNGWLYVRKVRWNCSVITSYY